MEPNSITDISNPAANLYRKHVEAAGYGCIKCRNKDGSSFTGLSFENDLCSFKYTCKFCGEVSEKKFNLEEIRTMMKHNAMGDSSDFFECFILANYYPYLQGDSNKYNSWCEILRAPKKSRWREAYAKIFGGK